MYIQKSEEDDLELIEFKKAFICLIYFFAKKHNKEDSLKTNGGFSQLGLPDFESALINNKNSENFTQIFFKTVSDNHKKDLLFLFLLSNNEYDNLNLFSKNEMFKSRYSLLLKNSNILNEGLIKITKNFLIFFKINEYENIKNLLNIEISIKELKKIGYIDILSSKAKFENQYMLDAQWLNDDDKEILKEQWRECLKSTINNFKYMIIVVFFMRYNLKKFNNSLNFFFTKEEIKSILIEYKKKLNISNNISNEDNLAFKIGLSKVNLFFQSNNVELFDEMDIKKLRNISSKILVFKKNINEKNELSKIIFNVNLMRNLKEVDLINNKIFEDNNFIHKYSKELLNNVLSAILKINLSEFEIYDKINKNLEIKISIINTSKIILFFFENNFKKKELEDIKRIIFNYTFDFVSTLSANVSAKDEYEKYSTKKEFEMMQQELISGSFNQTKIRKF